MNTKRVLLVVVTTIAAVIAMAAPAVATVSYPSGGAYRGITPQGPDWRFADSNGHGAVQVNYSRSPYSVQLGYKLSNSNIAICTGASNETIDLYEGSRKVLHDHHPNAGCSYQAHPSYQNGKLSDYRMRIHWTFRVNVGGRTGTATLNAVARFAITLV